MMHLLILLLCLLLLSACPRQQAADQTAPMGHVQAGNQPEQQSGGEPSPAPEPQTGGQTGAPEIYSSTDGAELIRDFGRFLNDRDLERYGACIHEQSPRRESLIWNFDDFAAGNRQVQIDSVSVQSAESGRALARYRLSVVNMDTGEQETEEGVFELVQLDDGHWVIWTVN